MLGCVGRTFQMELSAEGSNVNQPARLLTAPTTNTKVAGIQRGPYRSGDRAMTACGSELGSSPSGKFAASKSFCITAAYAASRGERQGSKASSMRCFTSAVSTSNICHVPGCRHAGRQRGGWDAEPTGAFDGDLCLTPRAGGAGRTGR